MPLSAGASLMPTGLCGPAELGPVCYSPASDAYVAEPRPVLTSSTASGILSLFRNREPARDPASVLPSENIDFTLSDHANEFPAEVMPYVNLMSRLETEFGVPVSFRVVQAQLSTGETVPQIVFYRTGDTPDLPTFRGGGSGPIRPGGEGPMPTATGLTVSLLGGSAAIVAFDHLLLDSLIENGLAPEEARAPLLFTSVMTAHLALHRAGLVSTSPTAGLRTMPTFMGFQILSSLLLERLGMDPGSAGTQFLSLTIASMPFLLASQSPALADALGAAAAGRGLTLAELGTMSTGAATLRVGALFARALGWIGIIDLGSRAGTWGIGHVVAGVSSGDYDDNMRLWNLVRMSQDLINQEDCGPVMAGALGMFMTTSDILLSLVDGEYEDFYNDRLENTRDGLVAGSDEFGDALHANLRAIIARNTPLNADGTPGSVDWEAVRRDVAAFYQDDSNAENIANGYELVDDATAPMTVSGVDTLIDVVATDGSIPDMDAFRRHFRVDVNRRSFEISQRLEARALELGLMEDVGGVRISRIPTDPASLDGFRANLTPTQRDFLDGEGLQLSLELMLLNQLHNAIEYGI